MCNDFGNVGTDFLFSFEIEQYFLLLPGVEMFSLGHLKDETGLDGENGILDAGEGGNPDDLWLTDNLETVTL